MKKEFLEKSKIFNMRMSSGKKSCSFFDNLVYLLLNQKEIFYED